MRALGTAILHPVPFNGGVFEATWCNIGARPAPMPVSGAQSARQAHSNPNRVVTSPEALSPSTSIAPLRLGSMSAVTGRRGRPPESSRSRDRDCAGGEQATFDRRGGRRGVGVHRRAQPCVDGMRVIGVDATEAVGRPVGIRHHPTLDQRCAAHRRPGRDGEPARRQRGREPDVQRIPSDDSCGRQAIAPAPCVERSADDVAMTKPPRPRRAFDGRFERREPSLGCAASFTRDRESVADRRAQGCEHGVGRGRFDVCEHVVHAEAVATAFGAKSGREARVHRWRRREFVGEAGECIAHGRVDDAVARQFVAKARRAAVGLPLSQLGSGLRGERRHDEHERESYGQAGHRGSLFATTVPMGRSAPPGRSSAPDRAAG